MRLGGLQKFLATLGSDALREAYSRMTDAERELVHPWIRSSNDNRIKVSSIWLRLYQTI